MADRTEILAFMGAAEGSWYSVPKGSKDVRYRATMANANSGVSFGVMQHDCATGLYGAPVLRQILDRAVAAPVAPLAKATSDRIYRVARTVNAQAHLTAADRAVVDRLLGLPASRLLIDSADGALAATDNAKVVAMIADAAKAWPKAKAQILTPGTDDYLRLEAYLMANLNRYPNNFSTFAGWLKGVRTPTINGPKGGFQLKAPPTVAEMHVFFQSLKIWDGTQGNYTNLRDRLDPTLDKLIKARTKIGAAVPAALH